MNWYDYQELGSKRANIYSQAGEDGILEYVFSNLGITTGLAVDLGASPDGCNNSNTRNLLNKGWRGFLVDGAADGSNEVHPDWITVENINSLLDGWNIPREIDLFSLDLDGNDWWIWRACQLFPKVAIVEYNPQFHHTISKTILYNPNHHYDNTTYYGASLLAYVKLAWCKGLIPIYYNGLNIIFVRSSYLPSNFLCRLDLLPVMPGQHPSDLQNRPWVVV